MKTKTIILAAVGVLTAFCFFSFKTNSKDGTSKIVLVSLCNGKGDNQGFIITYGDGKVEKRPTNIKALDTDNWIEIQSKAAVIVNEMNEKGYHFAGTHAFMLSTMIFEKN